LKVNEPKIALDFLAHDYTASGHSACGPKNIVEEVLSRRVMPTPAEAAEVKEPQATVLR
jgi:hypothetical protein